MTKIVELQTNVGNIQIELNEEAAPSSVSNFLEYIKKDFYTGIIFHRVIKGFVIQAGGFKTQMKYKLPTIAPIKNEANNGLKNEKYTISMARTSDPHSGSAQFFINTANNDFLNFKSETPKGWGYAVFGKVISGFEVVDQIEKVKVGRRGMHMDVPVDDVVIIKVNLI